MSATFALALLGAAAVAAAVPVTIDACVGVDPDEVRRLTAIELFGDETDRAEFEVLVGCRGEVQTLRLLHASRGVVDARSVDASEAAAPDARNRELALAIAELLRRAPEVKLVPEVAAPPPPKLPPRESGAAVETEPQTPLTPRADESADSRSEFAVAAAIVQWSHGHRLLGADLVVRVVLPSRFVTELRAGVRKTPGAVGLSRDEIDARGFNAALGLGFELAPSQSSVNLRLGARLGIDWLRYAISEPNGTAYASADAAGVHALATANASVALSERVRVEAEAAGGGALHPVVIRDNGQDVSGARGVMFLGSVGVAARF